MSKNKKPMTDAQREAKRARDAKYRAAKKAAKVAAQKKPVAKKPITVKKPTVAKKPEVKKIAKPVKTPLPKVKTADVEPIRIHIIKPGDIIRWEGFTQERILDYANRLIMSVGFDRMDKLREALKEKQKKVCPCKK